MWSAGVRPDTSLLPPGAGVTCGDRWHGARRGGSQAYLGARAGALVCSRPGDMMIDWVPPALRGVRPLVLCRPSACPARQGGSG
jgi:hypothetical protein